MAYYLLSPFGQRGIDVDVNDFFDSLAVFSNGITVSQNAVEGKPSMFQGETVYGFNVYLKTQDPLEGEFYDLHREEGQVLRFDGQSDDIVAFVLWFRRYLPCDCQMALYTSSNLNDFLEITSETNDEVVINAFAERKEL